MPEMQVNGSQGLMELISSLPVLLVDDEPQVLQSASIALRTSGFPHVAAIDDSRRVEGFLSDRDVAVIVLDLTMPLLSGHTLLERLATSCPDIPIIVMTANDDLDTAVHCMQNGAVDYLVKPVDHNRLVASVRRAVEMRSLRAELISLKDSLLTDSPPEREAFAGIVTQDRAMFAIFRYLEAVAPSPQPVLITGETGTGKELIARALHSLSKQPGELVAVNIAGFDDTLFSDTLFGHVRGAYTGADRSRDGLVTRAAGGTLFLDEIGDLTLPSQVKLLRLLQDGAYYPVGSDRPRQNSARVVVATNCDVAQAANKGSFRRDLYYRLRTHHLQLPPLRQRSGDLPLLVNYFVDKAARTLNRTAPAVPHSLYALLQRYSFPGNVRELEALVFDAVARSQTATLSTQSFEEAINGSAERPSPAPQAPSAAVLAGLCPDRIPTLSEAEEALIQEALARSGNNQGVAAAMLGISRQALNKRLCRRKDSSGALQE